MIGGWSVEPRDFYFCVGNNNGIDTTLSLVLLIGYTALRDLLLLVVTCIMF